VEEWVKAGSKVYTVRRYKTNSGMALNFPIGAESGFAAAVNYRNKVT
jgi:hypothetical protein